MADKGKGPEKRFKAGNVTATIWGNTIKVDGEDRKTHNVTIDKRYMDKNKEWQNTGSLNVNDLPRAILALQKAYEYLAIKDAPGTDDE
jgi:hypothetical protein